MSKDPFAGPGECDGKRVVPRRLLLASNMRVRAAWIRHEKDPRRSGPHGLQPKFGRLSVPREQGVHGAIAGDPLETRDARGVAFELREQLLDAGNEFARFEVARLRRGSLDDVGEPDAVNEQRTIVLRRESADAERKPCGRRQRGARHARPEAVAGTGKIPAAFRRVDRRIDTDERDVEIRAQQVG